MDDILNFDNYLPLVIKNTFPNCLKLNEAIENCLHVNFLELNLRIHNNYFAY